MNPRTADGDAFRFRADRPSLDLCSTVLWRHRTPVELLRRPEDLGRWLGEAGLWAHPFPVDVAGLRGLRDLRDALYRLFMARIEGKDLADAPALTRYAAHPVFAPHLTPDGQVHWHADDPLKAALSAIARDGIDLLTGPLAKRIRECGAPDCAFLFVDTSRPGTRKWCSPDRCGNRQYVRDHRARAHRGRVAGS